MQELSDWILPNNALLFSPQEWLRKTICVAHADHIQWESLECKSPVDSRAFQTSSKRNCYYCPLPALPKCHSILSLVEFVLVSASHSVVSCPLWPHGLCSPWNSPGQNTGVDSLSLLQGIFPAQGWNPGLPRCRWIFYQLSHRGSRRHVCFSCLQNLSVLVEE